MTISFRLSVKVIKALINLPMPGELYLPDDSKHFIHCLHVCIRSSAAFLYATDMRIIGVYRAPLEEGGDGSSTYSFFWKSVRDHIKKGKAEEIEFNATSSGEGLLYYEDRAPLKAMQLKTPRWENVLFRPDYKPEKIRGAKTVLTTVYDVEVIEKALRAARQLTTKKGQNHICFLPLPGTDTYPGPTLFLVPGVPQFYGCLMPCKLKDDQMQQILSACNDFVDQAES